MTDKIGHGGRRDNTKRRPDDKRGGTRIAGEGKKLGRPVAASSRTTITMHNDLKQQLEALADQFGMSFGDILEKAARAGLPALQEPYNDIDVGLFHYHRQDDGTITITRLMPL